MLALLFMALVAPSSHADEATAAAEFRKNVQPLLATYCYACHADGEANGGVAFDGFTSDAQLVGSHDVWWRAMKNVRAGIMPPAGEDRPTAAQREILENWVKYQAFGIDPANPDPGRVTIRRLNREEYRNTIRDLMGIDFKAFEEFPPDDSGYGFDNIADVLSVSPLLLEKYMQAAETIVNEAVPKVGKVVREETVTWRDLRDADGNSPEQMTFYKEFKVGKAFQAPQSGDYRLHIQLHVNGAFDFDPGRCTVTFKLDDQERWKQELGWDDDKKVRFQLDEKLESGEHRLAIELTPLTPPEKKKTSVDLRIDSVRIEGPLAEAHWVRPKNFDRFFTKDAPAAPDDRRAYAREVLTNFAKRAFRRPLDDRTIDRLVAIAEEACSAPGKTFEQGVSRAMVAVLASPRFIFRIEADAPGQTSGLFADVDEYSLASRLSYFLWSTMPDDELIRLAGAGELRRNLPAQLKRMIADRRADALVENFTGQWLQVRDVEGVQIDSRAVLFRELDPNSEEARQIEAFRRQRARENAQEADGKRRDRKEANRNQADAKQDAAKQADSKPADGKEAQKADGKADAKQATDGKREADAKQANARQQQRQFRRRFFGPRVEFDRELRVAMRRETEMLFAHVMREDKSLLELIDCDYTFLNERLARHYGIQDVTGREMRKVSLPPESPRGGVLTHGAILAVTSNPTRTSPVKRGLFILDNLIGMAPPPPPADVPDLEDSAKEFKDREPTLREILEVHRSNALCSSCHSRMDPLGLALENFNAMGMFREKERGQAIDTGGELVTGESFAGVRDLKRIIRDNRRADYYRCLTEKLLTYALGRGLEYYDVETVDRIVAGLEQDNGRVSTLLAGIVESAPFQRRRITPAVTVKAAESASSESN